MRINPRVVTSAAAIALTCAVTAAAYFYRRRNAEINEVMVFCKLQFNAYGCFDKLMSFMEAAKKSISVCMPGIQNPAIQGRLVRLMKEKNIQVRIVIDHTAYDSTDFLLNELIEVGAEIKCYNNLPYHMQHKFCLVDDKVLMTGTLNWGNDQSSDHWNYVYITSRTQLVEPVRNQFNNMWNQSSSVGLENHSEHSESHIEDSESHGEHNESHIEDSESHGEHNETLSEFNETLTGKHNESSGTEVLNPVTDGSKCIQVLSDAYRIFVTTPEGTIKLIPIG